MGGFTVVDLAKRADLDCWSDGATIEVTMWEIVLGLRWGSSESTNIVESSKSDHGEFSTDGSSNKVVGRGVVAGLEGELRQEFNDRNSEDHRSIGRCLVRS